MLYWEMGKLTSEKVRWTQLGKTLLSLAYDAELRRVNTSRTNFFKQEQAMKVAIFIFLFVGVQVGHQLCTNLL